MDFQQLPIGLGMGLAMNRQALERFSNLTEAEKEQVIFKCKDAKSKEEMDKIIASLKDPLI